MTITKCGTTAGYQKHHDDNTEPCRPCKDAQARWQRNYNKRRYLNRGPLMIDATGTQRRLQALARLGWSWRHVGAELGVSAARVSAMLKAKRVRRDTAAKILALYDRWSMTVGPSTHSRSRAIEKGWPPPLDWEGRDIDNPRALSHSQHGALVRAALAQKKNAA